MSLLMSMLPPGTSKIVVSRPGLKIEARSFAVIDGDIDAARYHLAANQIAVTILDEIVDGCEERCGRQLA